MGVFDWFKKKETPAPAAVVAPPPGNVVQGADGPVDFGRVKPDDPATFGALMGEYQDAVNNKGTAAAQTVARTWGFDPQHFSAMRSYMRRTYPGMRESAGTAPTFGGGAPAGTEPCTWEQYCEIHGAMAAWMQMGANVDANLLRYFNVTRDDLNRFGLHWSTGDMGRFQEQVNKSAVYTAKYLQLPVA